MPVNRIRERSDLYLFCQKINQPVQACIAGIECIDKKTFTITRGIGYYKISVLVRDLLIERKGKI